MKAVRQIALVRPGDVEIAKQLARLHHRLGNAAEAKDTLQTHLHNYPTAVDLELINILAELYMNAEEWSLAVDNIQYANTQLCGPTGLPIDLQVRILRGVNFFDGDDIIASLFPHGQKMAANYCTLPAPCVCLPARIPDRTRRCLHLKLGTSDHLAGVKAFSD